MTAGHFRQVMQKQVPRLEAALAAGAAGPAAVGNLHAREYATQRRNKGGGQSTRVPMVVSSVGWLRG